MQSGVKQMKKHGNINVMVHLCPETLRNWNTRLRFHRMMMATSLLKYKKKKKNCVYDCIYVMSEKKTHFCLTCFHNVFVSQWRMKLLLFCFGFFLLFLHKLNLVTAQVLDSWCELLNSCFFSVISNLQFYSSSVPSSHHNLRLSAGGAPFSAHNPIMSAIGFQRSLSEPTDWAAKPALT